MIHVSALIPILLPLFTDTTLSPPTGELAITAPSPTLAGQTAVVTLELALEAADPTIAATLEPGSYELLITAPDPDAVGESIISPSSGEVQFTAPDPSLVGPVLVEATGITIQFTAPDPSVSFSFAVNEDTLDVPGVPLQSSRDDLHRYQISLLLNELARGRIACTGKVTLIPDVEATYLRDSRIGPKSALQWVPLTDSARAEYFAGTMGVNEEDQTEGQALIRHANDPADDRTFRYVILGWG